MRPSSTVARVALVACLLLGSLAACTMKSDGDASDDAAPAEVRALFTGLGAATPDKLRGVWSVKVTGTNGTADLRFRFTDGKIIGGSRCEYTVDNLKPLEVGSSGGLTTSDLDAKTGEFVVVQTLNFSNKSDARVCSGNIDAGTWKFTIAGTALTMTLAGAAGSVKLGKLGD